MLVKYLHHGITIITETIFPFLHLVFTSLYHKKTPALHRGFQGNYC